MEQPPNQNEIFSRKLRNFKQLALRRGNLCALLVVITLLAGSFLAPFDIVLVTFQLSPIVATIILHKRPSFSKSLLIQQYVGVGSLALCIIKSIWLIFVLITHIYTVIAVDKLGQIVKNAGQKTIFIEIFPTQSELPRLIPSTDPTESRFSGVTLAIYGGIVIAIEIVSLIIVINILFKTSFLIKFLRGWDIDAFIQNYQRPVEEMQSPPETNDRTERPSHNISQYVESESSRAALYQSTTMIMGQSSFFESTSERGHIVRR